MNRLLKLAFLPLTSLMVSACSVFGYNHGVELAGHAVIEKDGAVEIREYPELVVVQTKASGPNEIYSDQRQAFLRLFDYIGGENEGDIEIPMTSPVIVNTEEDQKFGNGKSMPMVGPILVDQENEQRDWMMSFVLSSNYTLETAPKPTNPLVKLNTVGERHVAAIRFNGVMREQRSQQYLAKLENWLASSNYKATGSYWSAYYNPPWTLPSFKRNEILVPIMENK